MTLIVSLRIPDGIVIAGDSLATMMADVNVQADVNVTCPNCGHQHIISGAPVAHLNLPSTTYSYAQKVFPFLDEYGVGTSGAGQLVGKTIYFAIRELEQELRSSGKIPNGVLAVADAIGSRAHELLKEQVTDIDNAPDNWAAVGFQVVGYEGRTATTVVLDIGKGIKKHVADKQGCTRTGQGHVVDAIWALYKQRPADQAQYSNFSLQDAIAYAEFLISTTAAYQRFSRTIPQVGGDIDIALVTPFDKFKWIKQKHLSQVIGGHNEQ